MGAKRLYNLRVVRPDIGEDVEMDFLADEAKAWPDDKAIFIHIRDGIKLMVAKIKAPAVLLTEIGQD